MSANLGVSLVPESTKQLQIQGVAYRSLKAPVPTVGLGLAYKKHAPSQMAINFASVVQVACHHANEIDEIGWFDFGALFITKMPEIMKIAPYKKMIKSAVHE